ncbi:FAD-dependent oxidoreductase [Bosea vestrisii]|uniref:FAD-dependent oxidoreductase n=1 Tax=Bosea vestrisii TaxID=151416 RepID=UPI0024E00459|nr:FAD-dependent oxidoreductase [Bosea vestrisii]WID96655.1 FAD-dependent oxidoreductase [Bosea vestrisii]
MFTTLKALPEQAAYDLIVVGSGAAGLSAAVFAAIEGRSVLVIERTEYVGGTSALSAATTWIPNSMHAEKVATGDSLEKVARFLDGVVGNRSSARLRDAFLRAGPEAIATLEGRTDVHFRPYATHPDYESDVEGSTLRGRALEPEPFDGRQLGEDLNRIRPPIPEFTLFGGMMIDRTDIGHLLNLRRSWKSFRHAASILGRYGLDRLRGQRGTRLVMGNALIGGLLLTLKRHGGAVLLNASVTELLTGPVGATGVVVAQDGACRSIAARLGVVLAAGGYNRHPQRRAEMLNAPVPPLSPAAPGHTGAMQDLVLKLGARFGEDNLDNAFWAPVSTRKRPDGTTAVFPHFVLDRSKPGTVCVDRTGRRFVNESTSYHLFSRAMFEANRSRPTIPCWIITDAEGLRRYGLGMVRMGTRDLKPFLADGYLIEGATVPGLAGKLGVDPAALSETIASMNDYARSGIDPEFGRGTTDYHRVNGDGSRGFPNPTLGPIAIAPFYAVELTPGDIGAATGLVIDEDALVLGEGDRPIGRLYACGNEANSIMGGTYPGPGITIGPAITFAWRAVRHALGRGADRQASSVPEQAT